MGKNRLFLISVILLAISSLILGYFLYQNYVLKKNLLAIRTEFALTTENLNSVIDNLEQSLATITIERNDFEQKYYNQLTRVNQLASQVENIQGTVGNLEKLGQIDPELLKKYSKVYFLNENYAPETFIKIDVKYAYDPKEDHLFYLKVWPFLQNLLMAAENENIDIRINSAYRSFDEQAGLKSFYTVIYGSGANKFSADQGYSEHQLGTTVDFSTSEPGGDISDFEKTATYQWLINNAYKYGFVLSYPENNQYYVFEPWHWRFVGRALAYRLHQDGINFYDLDQRSIDNYLINFFD